jgi:hypothetical protein
MMRYRELTRDAALSLVAVSCVRSLRAVKAVLIDRVGDSMLCYVSNDWVGNRLNAVC